MKKIHTYSIFLLLVFIISSCEKETAEISPIDNGFPPTIDLISSNLVINVEDIDGNLNEEFQVYFLFEGSRFSEAFTTQGSVELSNQPVHESQTLIKVESENYLPNYIAQPFEFDLDYTLEFNVKHFDDIAKVDLGVELDYKNDLGISVSASKDNIDFSGNSLTIRSGIINNVDQIEKLIQFENAIDKEGQPFQVNAESIFYLDFVNENLQTITFKEDSRNTFEIASDFDLTNEYQLWNFNEVSSNWEEVEYASLSQELMSFESDHAGYFAISLVSSCADDTVPPIAICDTAINYDYSQNGDGFIYSTELDDGSYDLCSDNLLLEVKRMEDLCGDGSDQFSEKVGICSSDVGLDFNVILQVSDMSGNTNQCMIKVNITGSNCENDVELPVPVCEGKIIYNHAQNGDGFIYNTEFDDGSYDLCSSNLLFEVKRNEDLCGDNSDQFSDKISICSIDVGTTVLATLQVSDMSGNTNHCYVEVSVSNHNCVNDQTKPIIYVLTGLNTSFSNAPELWALDFDAGSYDNCSDANNLLFEIKKLDDLCNNGSDEYSDKIELCIGEIDTSIPVRIKVTDEAGNSDYADSVFTLMN